MLNNFNNKIKILISNIKCYIILISYKINILDYFRAFNKYGVYSFYLFFFVCDDINLATLFFSEKCCMICSTELT